MQDNLTAIWSKLLKREVPAGANFVEIGGTSLQMISMLLHVGQAYQVEIGIDEFLANPTLAQLEACVRQQLEALAPGPVAPAADAQVLPLLPVHYWLFERIDVNHFNIGHLFKISPEDKPRLLRAALDTVLRRHDGLRILLRRDAAGAWRQNLLPADDLAPWWHEVDLSATPEDELAAQINRICDEHHAGIRVEQQTFDAVYFNLGGQRGGRLFILLHHVLIDNISEGFFFGDLERAYLALRDKRAVQFAGAGRPVGDWARLLHDYAQRQALAFFDYWTAQNWDGYRPLPADRNPAALPAPSGPMAALGFVTRELDAGNTAALRALQQQRTVDPSYIVMAAMHGAFGNWSGSDILSLAMVHNGRLYQSIPDANVLHTVGWMINYATLYLRNPDGLRGIALANAVARQARAVNDDGLSLTCLKYMHHDAAVRERMARLPSYHIGFNFIPFADDSERDFLFERASEPCGVGEKWFSPDIKPFINVYFSGQNLKLKMGFSPCMYTEETIGAFLDDVVAQLQQIMVS